MGYTSIEFEGTKQRPNRFLLINLVLIGPSRFQGFINLRSFCISTITLKINILPLPL